jgi:hypothetical protein
VAMLWPDWWMASFRPAFLPKSADSPVMSLPSGLPKHVADGEDLARFLTSSSHYNASAARPAAFMPNPKNGETSVFRHGPEPFEELKSIAQAEVGADRHIHGAAIVKASVIREAKLEVRAKEPPPRHADIIDWPWSKDDPDYGKAEQKELAALIAQKANRPPLRF